MLANFWSLLHDKDFGVAMVALIFFGCCLWVLIKPEWYDHLDEKKQKEEEEKNAR